MEIFKKLVLICILVLISITFSGCASKKEGIVKFDDCRETINLDSNSLEKYYKDFTCTTYKTNSGKIIEGVCVSVETDKDVCKKAYIYKQEPEVKCGENEIVTVDDNCICKYGYTRNANNKCLLGSY